MCYITDDILTEISKQTTDQNKLQIKKNIDQRKSNRKRTNYELKKGRKPIRTGRRLKTPNE